MPVKKLTQKSSFIFTHYTDIYVCTNVFFLRICILPPNLANMSYLMEHNLHRDFLILPPIRLLKLPSMLEQNCSISLHQILLCQN